MYKVRKVWRHLLSVAVAIGLCLGYAFAAHAANAEEQANKAVVKRYLEVLGTPRFLAAAKELQANNYKNLRHEFENLKYNADDPVLSRVMQPEHVAIAGRKNTVTRLLGEGDWVAATYQSAGIHKSNLFGIPATDKSIDIEGTAVFRLAKGRIVEGWFMADEARLLRQLGVWLPARQDGKINLPPVYNDVRTFDQALAEHLAASKDTQEWRQTRLLLAYKSQPENRPVDYVFTGRPYTNYLRSGIVNIVERGKELGVEGSHAASMSKRRDMVANVISDGDLSMMRFRLTSENTGPLYGIPASGNHLHDWEVGFARFEGDKWVDGWWMGDELGLLLTIGNQQALNYLIGK
jgi:predicted ester cyclase